MPLFNEITFARHNASKLTFCTRLIVIFAFSDEYVVLYAGNGNSKKKEPALCERQLLLAANEEKNGDLFERWNAALLCVCVKSELPHSRIYRVKTTTARIKRPSYVAIATHEQSFIRIVRSVPGVWFFARQRT